MAEATTPPVAVASGAERLFAEFPVPTLDQWREEVVRLLKGAPYDKKMLTPTYEGLTLQPIYTPADTESLPHMGSLPGAFPFVRGTEPLGKRLQGWLVAQELPYPSPKAFNEALRQDLERGQNAVNLVLDAASQAGLDPDQAPTEQVGKGGTSIASLSDLDEALKDVDLEATPALIVSGTSALPLAAQFLALVQRRGCDTSKIQASLGFDPLGTWAGKGQLPMTLDQAWDELAELTRTVGAALPKARTFVVCGHPYHEAGASAAQELGLCLANAVAMLRAMESRGLDVDAVAPRIQFRLTLGSQFFLEIAKLRAARLLWSQVVKACGGTDASAKMQLHARTGRFNKTQFDPHVNLLRATTEAFSAVVGGADSLHVGAFDEVLGQPSDLGRRIARNTQLMLREESKLDHVVDLAGGSWTVERLTHELAQKAWSFFQELEQRGGLAACLEQGFVQEQIGLVAAARQKAIAQRTESIIGTNQYPNALEALPELRPVDHGAAQQEAIARLRRGTAPASGTGAALVAAAPEASLGQLVSSLNRTPSAAITPLKAHRGAEAFETLRKAVLSARAAGKNTKVFLACLGPIGAYMPRLDFTRGFFQVGGFEVLDQAWFKTPQEAAAAAKAAGAPIVVAVGLDDTYVEAVPALAQAVKAAAPASTVLVAGLLKEHTEAFKAAGVDDFIHVRSDVQTVLSGLARTLEVC